VEGSEPPSTEKRLSSTEPKRIPLFAKDGEAWQVQELRGVRLSALEGEGVLVVLGSFFGPIGVSHFREDVPASIEVLEEMHNLMKEFMKNAVR
jgi:aspartate/methionine/tyrosine aminotransferase